MHECEFLELKSSKGKKIKKNKENSKIGVRNPKLTHLEWMRMDVRMMNARWKVNWCQVGD